MTNLRIALDEALESSAVTYPRFQALVVRLLDKGALCRTDSRVEADLYDDAVRVERLLADYFALSGCRLVFDHTHEYARLYPPLAAIPGVPEEDDSTLTAGMKARIGPNVVAAALVLRFLYGEAVQAGKLEDDGEAETTLEAVATAIETRLKREFPSQTERRELFRQLREFKLIRYSKDETFEDPRSAMFIRPMITGFVHEGALDAVLLDGATDVDMPVEDVEE